MIPKKKVLDISLTCLSFEEQIMLILRWAKIRTSKAICLANVHMIMEAYWSNSFKQVLDRADVVAPDGKPLVWMLRKLGINHQDQVAGMDIFLSLCDRAETSGVPIYFLGSTPEILDTMKQKLSREYPILKIAGMKSLPVMSIDEIRQNTDSELIDEINQSGAGIIFVCLGCPKQEIWMSQYQGLIKGVMIGVGAVFSMYAGLTPRAPYLVKQYGLEWLYRLKQEPRRLWHRYSSTIPPFVYLALKELLVLNHQAVISKKMQFLESNTNIDVENLNFSPEKLGDILVRQNVINQEELNRALLQQRLQPELKLGEILVRSNFISLSQLKFYLRNQNIKLGQILIEKKIIEQNTLKKALRLQPQSKKKLGQLLVELEIISENKLKEILLDQYTRYKGLFWVEDADIYNSAPILAKL